MGERIFVPCLCQDIECGHSWTERIERLFIYLAYIYKLVDINSELVEIWIKNLLLQKIGIYLTHLEQILTFVIHNSGKIRFIFGYILVKTKLVLKKASFLEISSTTADQALLKSF